MKMDILNVKYVAKKLQFKMVITVIIVGIFIAIIVLQKQLRILVKNVINKKKKEKKNLLLELKFNILIRVFTQN